MRTTDPTVTVGPGAIPGPVATVEGPQWGGRRFGHGFMAERL